MGVAEETVNHTDMENDGLTLTGQLGHRCWTIRIVEFRSIAYYFAVNASVKSCSPDTNYGARPHMFMHMHMHMLHMYGFIYVLVFFGTREGGGGLEADAGDG